MTLRFKIKIQLHHFSKLVQKKIKNKQTNIKKNFLLHYFLLLKRFAFRFGIITHPFYGKMGAALRHIEKKYNKYVFFCVKNNKL